MSWCCRLRTLFDESNPKSLPWLHGQQKMFGPAGLSPDSDGRYHFLLQGSSFQRQVWEAIACGFRNHITDLQVGKTVKSRRVNVGAKSVKLYFNPVRDIELIRERGCHTLCGSKRNQYRPGVRSPPCWPKCSDNVTMVELDGIWRFYHILAPTRSSPQKVQYYWDEIFGLNPRSNTTTNQPKDSTIDVALAWAHIVSESGKALAPQKVIPSYQQSEKNEEHVTLSPKMEIRTQSWPNILKKIQRRDLGWAYFEDNPYTYRIPGMHACMPGIPDDEANLLLFQLITGYVIDD